jgi:hypothetical protein
MLPRYANLLFHIDDLRRVPTDWILRSDRHRMTVMHPQHPALWSPLLWAEIRIRIPFFPPDLSQVGQSRQSIIGLRGVPTDWILRSGQ